METLGPKENDVGLLISLPGAQGLKIHSAVPAIRLPSKRNEMMNTAGTVTEAFLGAGLAPDPVFTHLRNYKTKYKTKSLYCDSNKGTS